MIIDLILLIVIGAIIYSQYPLTFDEIVTYTKDFIISIGEKISPNHPLIAGLLILIIIIVVYFRYREAILNWIMMKKKPIKRVPLRT